MLLSCPVRRHHANSAMTGLTNELVRADMLFFETSRGKGAVFATGSIAWAGALPVRGFQNAVSKVTENVIRRFLDPTPFALDGTATGATARL